MEISLLAFALLALVVVMTPGPTVLLALSNGSRFGLGTAGYGIAGAALSDAVLIAAAALGLGALLTASALLFSVVKGIGAAYLVWLGVRMLRSSGRLEPVATQVKGSRPILPAQRFGIVRKSFLAAVTNPKGYLFFTAFLPQFIDPSQPLLAQYLVLASIFIAIDIAAMTAYAGLGVRAMRLLGNSGALWIERLCGSLLVALGIALALLRRGAS